MLHRGKAYGYSYARTLSFALLVFIVASGGLEAQTERPDGSFEERFLFDRDRRPPEPSPPPEERPPASSEQKSPADVIERLIAPPAEAASPPARPQSEAAKPVPPAAAPPAGGASPDRRAVKRHLPAGRRIGSGPAAWYEHPGRTASGEIYNPDGLTAAHRSLPFGTRLRVVNLRNQRAVTVRINDRTPPRLKYVIDLSRGSARAIGLKDVGPVALYRLN